jgi:ribosomal protein S18 acetylase RimI-like enzyme
MRKKIKLLEKGMTVVLSKLKIQEIRTVSNVLTDAFEHDPLFKTIFYNKLELNEFFNFATIYVNKFGEIYILNDFSGVSLWLPPVVPFLSIKFCLKNFNQFVSMCRFAFKVRMKSIVKLLKLSAYARKYHPKNGHYYLFAIGVNPSFKGKGIGKQLLSYCLEKIDSIPVYLENSNSANLDFYSSFGLNVLKSNTFNGCTIFHMGKNITTNLNIKFV